MKMLTRFTRLALDHALHFAFLLGWWCIAFHCGADAQRRGALDPQEQLPITETQARQCPPAGCPAPPADTPPKPIKIRLEPGVPTPYATSVRVHYQVGSEVSIGSGTVVDGCAKRALILTCAHLFRDRGGVYNRPSEARGTVHVDLFESAKNGLMPPTHRQTLPGRIVDFDGRRDVGLVAIEPDTDLPASPLVLDDFRASVSDPMISVGCSHGADPSAREHKVVGERGDGTYASIDVTNPPVEGRSGGGLFTTGGRLAGVCLSTDGIQGQYAHPTSLRFILARNGRDDLAHPQPTSQPADPDLQLIPGQSGQHARPSPQAPAPQMTPFPPPTTAIPATDYTPWVFLAGIAVPFLLRLLAGTAGSNVARPLTAQPVSTAPVVSTAPPDPQARLHLLVSEMIDQAEREHANKARAAKVESAVAQILPTSAPSSPASNSTR